MDEKKFACLAKCLIRSWEIYWEKRGIDPGECRAVLADDPDSDLVWPPDSKKELPNSWHA